jgi:hypothetical protein
MFCIDRQYYLRVIEVLKDLPKANSSHEEEKEAMEKAEKVRCRNPQHPLEKEQVELSQNKLYSIHTWE